MSVCADEIQRKHREDAHQSQVDEKHNNIEQNSAIFMFKHHSSVLSSEYLSFKTYGSAPVPF